MRGLPVVVGVLILTGWGSTALPVPLAMLAATIALLGGMMVVWVLYLVLKAVLTDADELSGTPPDVLEGGGFWALVGSGMMPFGKLTTMVRPSSGERMRVVWNRAAPASSTLAWKSWPLSPARPVYASSLS